MLRTLLLALLTADAAQAQPQPSDPASSGGLLIFEQAAFDVEYYDLELRVLPAQQALEGQLTAHAIIVLPTDAIVLDLDTTFTVAQVLDAGTGETMPFERLGGRLLIDLGWTKQPGDRIAVR